MSRNFKIGTDTDAQGKFIYGLMTQDPPQKIPDGAASDSVNWITKNGKIELNRGYAPLGTELTGSGRVTGLIVGNKAGGLQVPFRSRGKKAEYYDVVTADWIEISTDMLGTAADGEDISWATFDSRAGPQVWLNSPHSGPKKIMIANPGDYSDMYNASLNYKAHLSIIQNTAFNFRIENKDNNILRLSYVETRGLSDYTQVVAEVLAAGPGTTFTGTLAFRAGQTKRTCLDVSVTDGVETFADNMDGTLTGNLGGTGTINYTTGAISVTFHTAVLAVNVTVTYRYVNETDSGGIANFVVPGSRVAGDPNVFQQFTGGNFNSLFSLKEHRFCAHERCIYDVSISLDDTDATNLVFRENFGVPSFRGGAQAPEGIYTVNVADPSQPRFVVIGFFNNSTEITPKSISDDLNLSQYNFDDLVVFAFNEFILYECQSPGGSSNDTTFVYNRINKFWDKLDYAISCGGIYNGTLIAGDSVSNNVFTLFSGLDADGANIYNFWRGGISKLKIKSLKKVKKIKLEGEIGPNQKIRMYGYLDRGARVEILDEDGGAIIDGQGDYVDRTQSVAVGAPTLGTTEVGGGSDGIEAYHYERMISFNQDRFSEIQVEFQAPDLGYASITLCEFHDIRVFQDKPARKYRL